VALAFFTKQYLEVRFLNPKNRITFRLLNFSIFEDDEYSGLFLVDNNISVNLQSYEEKKTALMYLAASTKALSKEMLNLVRKIIKSYSIDLNIQEKEGNTALHLAVIAKNSDVFKEILLNSVSKPNLNIKNKLEQTVLWLSLIQSEETSKKSIFFNQKTSLFI
jgi:ankyrin repeat protein